MLSLSTRAKLKNSAILSLISCVRNVNVNSLIFFTTFPLISFPHWVYFWHTGRKTNYMLEISLRVLSGFVCLFVFSTLRDDDSQPQMTRFSLTSAKWAKLTSAAPGKARRRSQSATLPETARLNGRVTQQPASERESERGKEKFCLTQHRSFSTACERQI